MKRLISVLLISGIILGISAATFAGQFAGSVVSYDSGAAPATAWPSLLPYDNAAAALGMPDDVTGDPVAQPHRQRPIPVDRLE